MNNRWTTSAFTTEFGQEFESERERWLRRRFLWYTGTITCLNGAVFIPLGIVGLATGASGSGFGGVGGGIALLTAVTLSTTLYATAFAQMRRRQVASRELILNTVFWLIVVSGVLRLVAALIGHRLVPPGIEQSIDGTSVGYDWMVTVFVTHVFACLFLPWTPRESFRPLIPLLALYAVFKLLSADPWIQNLVAVAVSPLLALPGVAICWWRHSRFRERFAVQALRGRYTEMKRELVDARRIHEALFPPPITTGPVRFTYRYEPMRQIGGDYLYAFQPPLAGQAGARDPAVLSLIIVDVTGHGIPAALTVNRLHGELDRIYAESPETSPGEALALLNRYVHLTLSSHSVYVTALCVRADAKRATVEYASGGHPPAFIRAVDGTVEQLDSTAFVLGACPAADFKPDQRTLKFGPGDALIAYTDGAIEARDSTGRYFGIVGLQKVIAGGRPDAGTKLGDAGWTAAVLSAVDRYRFGPPADDTLVVELSRPLDSAAHLPTGTRTRAGVAAAAP